MHRRLLQGIENEPRMRRTADAPANDLASIGIDDKGGETKPFQVAACGGNPTPTCSGPERGTGGSPSSGQGALVRDRRPVRLAHADNALVVPMLFSNHPA